MVDKSFNDEAFPKVSELPIRGRGTSSNPMNRFEKISVEPDPPQVGLLAIPLLPLAIWVPVALGLPFARGKIG